MKNIEKYHDADSFLEKVESILKRLEDGRRESRDRNEALDEGLIIDCLTDFDKIIEEEKNAPGGRARREGLTVKNRERSAQ